MPKAYGFVEYGGTDTQEFWDQEMPQPGASELLVRVKAAGVNPVDWKIREGYLQEVSPLTLPAVLGGEVSGVVQEVGKDVEGFAVGDEVFGTAAPGSGGYAEYTLTTAAATAKKPVHVSFTDAATLPIAGATAYDGVEQLGLEAGQTLLINGIGGGVGVAAAQIARDRGINVIGTAGSAKRELVESLGATMIESGDGVAERVRQIMPDGVDGILDAAGGESLRQVAPLVADPSKLVSTGDFSVGELGGSVVARDHTARVLDAIAALVADGKLDPHVQDVVPLDRAGEALQAVEAGHARGKVVIEVSS